MTETESKLGERVAECLREMAIAIVGVHAAMKSIATAATGETAAASIAAIDRLAADCVIASKVLKEAQPILPHGVPSTRLN